MAAINLLLWEEGIKVTIRENDVCCNDGVIKPSNYYVHMSVVDNH